MQTALSVPRNPEDGTWMQGILACQTYPKHMPAHRNEIWNQIFTLCTLTQTWPDSEYITLHSIMNPKTHQDLLRGQVWKWSGEKIFHKFSDKVTIWRIWCSLRLIPKWSLYSTLSLYRRKEKMQYFSMLLESWFMESICRTVPTLLYLLMGHILNLKHRATYITRPTWTCFNR